MKKILSVLLMGLFVLGCQKDELVDESASNESLKASTTVTTESALKTAIKNAKAGDVITVSGTI